MKYDFDQVFDRNTDSLKWDILKPIFGREDLAPMWVADNCLKIKLP